MDLASRGARPRSRRSCACVRALLDLLLAFAEASSRGRATKYMSTAEKPDEVDDLPDPHRARPRKAGGVLVRPPSRPSRKQRASSRGELPAEDLFGERAGERRAPDRGSSPGRRRGLRPISRAARVDRRPRTRRALPRASSRDASRPSARSFSRTFSASRLASESFSSACGDRARERREALGVDSRAAAASALALLEDRREGHEQIALQDAREDAGRRRGCRGA